MCNTRDQGPNEPKHAFFVLNGTSDRNNDWRHDVIEQLCDVADHPRDLIYNPWLGQRDDDSLNVATAHARWIVNGIFKPYRTGAHQDLGAGSIIRALICAAQRPGRTVLLVVTDGMSDYTTRNLLSVLGDVAKQYPQVPIFTDMASFIAWADQELAAYQLSTTHPMLPAPTPDDVVALTPVGMTAVGTLVQPDEPFVDAKMAGIAQYFGF